MDELQECGCWGGASVFLEVCPEVEEGEVWLCVFMTKGCVYGLDVFGKVKLKPFTESSPLGSFLS